MNDERNCKAKNHKSDYMSKLMFSILTAKSLKREKSLNLYDIKNNNTRKIMKT